VDLMVVDALQYANPVLKITEKIHDPEQFVRLDDTLLKQIELWGSAPGWRACEEDDRHMRKAQAVVLRLRNRDMYKFCGEVVVPNNVCSKCPLPPPPITQANSLFKDRILPNKRASRREQPPLPPGGGDEMESPIGENLSAAYKRIEDDCDEVGARALFVMQCCLGSLLICW